MWGVRDAGIQKKLLSEPDLTLDRAIRIAQSTETAELNLKEMDSEAHKEIHYMGKKQYNGKRGESSAIKREDRGNGRDYRCFRCGKT